MIEQAAEKSASARAYELVNEAVKVISASLAETPDPQMDEAETEAFILLGTLRKIEEARRNVR